MFRVKYALQMLPKFGRDAMPMVVRKILVQVCKHSVRSIKYWRSMKYTNSLNMMWRTRNWRSYEYEFLYQNEEQKESNCDSGTSVHLHTLRNRNKDRL